MSPARHSASGKPPIVPRSQTPGLAARRTAAALLRRVFEGNTPLDALLEEEGGYAHFRDLDARDRSLVRAILGVALRRHGEISAAIAGSLNKPLPGNAGALVALLHVGAAQVLFLDVPDHAAVSLAVTHSQEDRTTRNARGLVNSVLRRIARERDDILARPDAARLNVPDWLWRRWSANYGKETAASIAAAHLHHPELDLSAKTDPEELAQRLGGTALPSGSVRLSGHQRVTELPGFAEGDWWVQDMAAALPARLLAAQPGEEVADLCAAPGGKTAQLAAAGAHVTAVDISPARLRRVDQNLQWLRLPANLVAADILEWDPRTTFDAVLLDAPCSATGTIRRHPDVQWLKRPQDIAALAELQGHMLSRAAGWVKPGGALVFCTCSLEPEEGDAHVAPFLAEHPDFALEPVRPEEVSGLDHLVTAAGALRTLPSYAAGPGAVGMDGFFAARFRRRL